MKFEGIMLSEKSQRKTNTVWSHLYMKSKKTKQKQTQKEKSDLWLPEVEGRVRGKWRKVIKRLKLSAIRWVSTRNIMYNIMTRCYNCCMIYRKVKKVNHEFSLQGVFFLFIFLLCLYEMMHVSWTYCGNHFTYMQIKSSCYISNLYSNLYTVILVKLGRGGWSGGRAVFPR